MMQSVRPFHRVLAALDDSPCAKRVLFHALSFAHAFRAEVYLLHVIEHPEMERLCSGARIPPALAAVEQAAEQYLAARSQADRDLEEVVQSRTRCATTAASAILQEATASGADLIVIGTRGRGGGADPAEIGCTVSKVVRQAPCPVLTVGPVGGRVPEFAQRILVPVDFSSASLRALRLVDTIAQRFDAKLLVLHVVEPLAHLLRFRAQDVGRRTPMALDRAQKQLETLVRDEGVAAPYQLLTTCDRSADGILSQARRYDAHLIVQGARGQAAHTDAALGGVAAEVVRRAACPVVTVQERTRAPRDDASASTGEAPHASEGAA